MVVEPPEHVVRDAVEEAEHGDGQVHDHVLDRMEITWDTDTDTDA